MSSLLLNLITRSHLSFHIRWADSYVSIEKSRDLPSKRFFHVSTRFARLHPRIVPNRTSGHSVSLRHHSSSASFQITFLACESSHSTKMCSIDSMPPHRLHVPLCSKFGMLFQKSLRQYAPCRLFHRKLRIFLGMSLSLIDFHICDSVGVSVLISLTA